MNSVNKSRINQKGSILPLAVVMIVILALIGLGLLRLGLNARLLAIHETAKLAARAAADAGITKAAQILKHEYAANPAIDCATLIGIVTAAPSETFGESFPTASYSYTVSYNANDPIYLKASYEIVSTGTAGGQQKIVHAKLTGQNYFFGMGLQNILSAQNNDGFLADSTDANQTFTVKTNSTAPGAINLSKSTITGDVAVGFGGDPSVVISNPASVTGKIYASDNYNYPLPQPPGVLPAGPAPAGGNYTITGSCQYVSIDTAGNFVIAPNLGDVQVHVTGNMNVSDIAVGSGSSLSLYVGQNLAGYGSGNNVTISNNNNDPTKLMIYGAGTGMNIEFKNNAAIYASIYAPNADVVFKNNGDIYGAVIADSFTFKNNSTFYYDTTFNKLNLFGVPDYYLVVVRWWED